MVLKKTFLLLAGAAALFASCKKEDGISVTNPIVGKWQFVKSYYTHVVAGDTVTDVTFLADLPLCRQDDYNIYLPDSIYYYSKGTLFCDSEDRRNDTSRYRIIGPNLSIEYQEQQQVRTRLIDKLTNDSLVDGYFGFGVTGTMYKVVNHFKKIP